ncbi:Pyruvate/2-oxoglutarate dehydrogenase complex, dihydrolipoamide acyltransferase (E2) component, and related enzymes [hydrothermal vent metagenome]|uniref:Pyruvate/2-oxoglutarate dehydrogenase complex, dihydrolipoamide acyltransferase (E2) component, and related enzymes n=1 Tax=hydrothermal vent metagenome TaxID=652676 RepID=A0A3B0SHY1_9ZZZZ
MSLPRILVIILVFTLAACSSRKDETNLRRIKKTGNGPDEFSIIPGKPLQSPESYAALPAPTPDGGNLTDQSPNADGIAALGGNPAALNETGIAPNERGLVAHAARYGVTPGIRQTLAKEDLKLRKRSGKVNIFRIGPSDDYSLAYKRQWLDAFAEERRLRRLGIATPSSPPEDQ